MRKIYFIILLIAVVISANAQTTTYFNAKGKEVKSLDKASYYSIEQEDTTKTNRYVERKYSKSGQLLSESRYIWVNYNTKQLNGLSKEWYENGRVKKFVEYNRGVIDGRLLECTETGDTIRNNLFTNGSLVYEKPELLPELLNDSVARKIAECPECMPQFPGGEKALLKYIADHLIYPPSALSKNLAGTVIVCFVIDYDGKIKNIRIIKGFDIACEEASIQVVRSMPNFKPATLDGKAVPSYYILPISFRITR